MQVCKYDTPEERLEYIKMLLEYYTFKCNNYYSSKEEILMILKQCYQYASAPCTSKTELENEIKTCCQIGSYSWANLRVVQEKQKGQTTATFLIKKKDYPMINRWIFDNNYSLDSVSKIVEEDYLIMTISWNEKEIEK